MVQKQLNLCIIYEKNSPLDGDTLLFSLYIVFLLKKNFLIKESCIFFL